MRLRRGIICGASLVFALSLCPLARGVQRRSAPAAAVSAVKSFYRFHFSHDMGLAARSIRLRRRWFTPELYGLLLREMKREDEHRKTNPDDVPYYNGDPFTNSQEYPEWFRISQSSFDGSRAKVRVTFYWGEPRATIEDERIMDIVLTRHGGRWLIGDFIDADGSRLRDELRREKFLP